MSLDIEQQLRELGEAQKSIRSPVELHDLDGQPTAQAVPLRSRTVRGPVVAAAVAVTVVLVFGAAAMLLRSAGPSAPPANSVTPTEPVVPTTTAESSPATTVAVSPTTSSPAPREDRVAPTPEEPVLLPRGELVALTPDAQMIFGVLIEAGETLGVEVEVTHVDGDIPEGIEVMGEISFGEVRAILARFESAESASAYIAARSSEIENGDATVPAPQGWDEAAAVFVEGGRFPPHTQYWVRSGSWVVEGTVSRPDAVRRRIPRTRE